MLGSNGLPSARYRIRPVSIGGGGWVTKLKFAPDGTAFCGHDTWGLSRLDGARWTLLANASNGFAAQKIDPFEGSLGAYDIGVGSGGKVYFAAGSVGLTDSAVYRSTDNGATFTRSSFYNFNADGNSGARMVAPRLAVDPSNSDVVYLGTQNGKVIRSLDGFVTHAQVAAFTTNFSAYNDKGVIIAIDGSSALTSGRRSVVYAGGDGEQVRKSTDGGGTFTAIGSGPTTHGQMVVDSQGTLWHTDASNGPGVLRKLVGTTWTTVATGLASGPASIAIDPTTPGRMAVAADDSQIALSTNYGASWIACSRPNVRVAADVPWLAWTLEEYMSCGMIAFDPVVAGRLWLAEGIGVWRTQAALPTVAGQPITFHSVNAGIEQMVSNHGVKPAGKPFLMAFEDRNVFREAPNDTYPLRHADRRDSLIHVRGIAKSPQNEAFIVAANQSKTGTVPTIAYSLDGGGTFLDVPNVPTFASGGTIGNVAATRDGQFIGAPWGGSDQKLMFWPSPTATPVEITHVEFGTGTAFGSGAYANNQVFTADGVTPGVFYAYARPQENTSIGGVFRLTVSADGATRTLEKMSGRVSPDYYHVKLRAVPGQAGHLLLMQGHLGSPSPSGPSAPSDISRLRRSTDGGATFNEVAGFREVHSVGFGKPAPGKTYPTMMIGGGYNGAYGLWVTYDNFTTVAKVADWPGDRMDFVRYVEGDMEAFGRFWIGFAGTSVMRADYADERVLLAA